MNKARPARTSDGMRTEYDLRGGVRGKYAGRFAARANVVILAPDVAEAFPSSTAVNEALRLLIRVARRPRRGVRVRRSALEDS